MNRRKIEAALLLTAYVGMIVSLMTFAYIRSTKRCEASPMPWFCFKVDIP